MNFRSHNPVFTRALRSRELGSTEVATYKGVAFKTLFYLFLVVVGAGLGIGILASNPEGLSGALIFASIGGFIAGIVAVSSPRSAKVAGSIYAILQGMIIGVVSLIFEAFASGVITITLLSTFAVLLVVTTIYLTGLVKVNDRFVRFLSTFALSILVSWLFIWIFSLFSSNVRELFYNNLGVSMFISVLMVFLATLYLLFDLENIRQVVEGGYPKQLEWYVSFGLIFTILWLYMELLPLVFQILVRDRN